jgi:hypothetical protein
MEVREWTMMGCAFRAGSWSNPGLLPNAKEKCASYPHSLQKKEEMWHHQKITG